MQKWQTRYLFFLHVFSHYAILSQRQSHLNLLYAFLMKINYLDEMARGR